MKIFNKALLALLLSCSQCYLSAQDRSKAHGYAFSEEELASYPQKTDLPTVYLQVYKTTVDSETGATSLTLYGDGNPQLEDYTTVFGTKNDWYYITQIIIRDDNGTIEERNETTGLRGRGNSTWNLGNGQYKKGLRLKFPSKVKLLGDSFANAKSWTLLANNYDPTLIRNAMAYELGKKVGMTFCPAYKFVDLVVCDHYMGTYQISDQVQIGKGRIDINEATGYFIEILKNKTGFLEDPYIRVEMGNSWTLMDVNIKSPDPDVATESGPSADSKYDALHTHLNKIAGLSNAGQFDRPNNWRKYVDIDAATKAFIALDITGNYDGVVGNDYASLNDLDSKLVFGPLWDLDLAWGGLVNGSDMTEKHFWQGEDAPFGKICQRVFEEDPYFVKALYERWQQVYDNGRIITYLQGKVDDLAGMVSQSAALNYSKEEGGAGHDLNKSSWNDANNYADLSSTYTVMKTFIKNHIEWLNNNYKERYDALGCASLAEIPESGLFFDGTNVLWNGGENVYTYVATANQVRIGAELTVQAVGEGAYFFAFTTDPNSKWFQTSGGSSLIYTKTLDANDVALLRANDNAFRIVVSSGTLASVTLVAPPCTEHNYTNCEYAKQPDGTYRRMCTVCSEVETNGEVYYQFTVYPESATTITVYDTCWQPDSEHPNAIATIKVTSGLENNITGYNIINTNKNAEGNKICPDFRLTDGHPYFGDDKFVATKATYSRSVSKTWGTMVLPFKHQQQSTSTASYYHLKSVSGTGSEQTFVLTAINPDEEGNASAYVPVFFCRTSDDVTTVTVSANDVTVKKSSTDMTSSVVEGWTMKGVMAPVVFNVADEGADAGRNLYYISNNKFYHATGTLTMNPFRAYMEYTSSEPAAARFNLIVDDDSQSTAISKITADAVIVCVEQGGLRIEGAAGTSVRVSSVGGTLLLDTVLPDNKTLFIPLQSGVYIVNGNKVVVK